jgi:plastocyanin
MRSTTVPKLFLLLLFIAGLIPQIATAETHIITVSDNSFSPASLTIQVGDTIEWRNAAGGNPHNVTSDDGTSFSSDTNNAFNFPVTFNSAGSFPYTCTLHPGQMNGTITVVESTNGDFLFNAGLNGSWWGGLARSGEGGQIEVSDGGNGTFVVVITIYSYDPLGEQIFMIAVGDVDGNTVEADLFITTGGLWGTLFDPMLVMESQWGTGTFTGLDCESVNVELRPNAEYQALNYHTITLDWVRLTTPLIACPFP